MNISPCINKIIKKDYQLLKKIDKSPIADLDTKNRTIIKDLNSLINEEVFSYSYIEAGKKSDVLFSKEIISFFNKAGQMIARMTKDKGKFVRLRTYHTNLKNNCKVINTYIPSEQAKNMPQLSVEETFVNNTDNENHTYWAVKRIIHSIKDGKKIREFNFSKLYGNMQKSQGKENEHVSMKLSENKKGYKLFDFHKSKNCQVKRNDEWLVARILNPKTGEGLLCLTKKLLKDKGLRRMNINIIPFYSNEQNNLIAFFSLIYGNIYYLPKLLNFPSSNIVEIIAHEVEHAKQCSLIARIGKANSPYERHAEKFFRQKSLTDEELKTAYKYAIARYEYPEVIKSKVTDKYYNNYLEFKADEEGYRVKKQYLSKNFSYFDSDFNQ